MKEAVRKYGGGNGAEGRVLGILCLWAKEWLSEDRKGRLQLVTGLVATGMVTKEIVVSGAVEAAG